MTGTSQPPPLMGDAPTGRPAKYSPERGCRRLGLHVKEDDAADLYGTYEIGGASALLLFLVGFRLAETAVCGARAVMWKLFSSALGQGLLGNIEVADVTMSQASARCAYDGGVQQ